MAIMALGSIQLLRCKDDMVMHPALRSVVFVFASRGLHLQRGLTEEPRAQGWPSPTRTVSSSRRGRKRTA